MLIRAAWGFLICLAASPLASAQPTVTSGSISQTPIDVTKPNASPAITLNITGEATVIFAVYQSPAGRQVSEEFQSLSTGGTGFVGGYSGDVRLQGYVGTNGSNGSVLSPYAQPGTWTLVSILVAGKDNASISYAGSALSALFPKLTFPVTNPGKPDTTPATISSASILTPTVSVSKGPQPAILVHATDALSGVNTIGVFAGTSNRAAVLNFYNRLPSSPANTGAFRLTAPLQPGTPAGTYTIFNAILIDNAGNPTSISNVETLENLFGNNLTITVTN